MANAVDVEPHTVPEQAVLVTGTSAAGGGVTDKA
jgi:hypothetical protein